MSIKDFLMIVMKIPESNLFSASRSRLYRQFQLSFLSWWFLTFDPVDFFETVIFLGLMIATTLLFFLIDASMTALPISLLDLFEMNFDKHC